MMIGKKMDVAAADGQHFQCYTALPEGGTGPGLVLLHEAFGVTEFMRHMADRFAADGYVVLVPDLYWRIEPKVDLSDGEFEHAMELYQQFNPNLALDDINATIAFLCSMPEHTGGVGVVGYCLGGLLAAMAAARCNIDCAVAYYGVGIAEHLGELENVSIPLGFHYGTEDGHCEPELDRIKAFVANHENMSIWMYQGADHGFSNRFRSVYHSSAEEIAYVRTLTVLRAAIGPKFDLEAQWESHMYYEFVAKDAYATLSTMVADPYVNMTATMMGGVGHDMLLRFYKYHFCDSNPNDTEITVISRTVGVNRVVDEMIFSFTHDQEVPWLLPDIAPTGRHIDVSMVAIVSFRGGKIYNEHIHFDQASVLVQAGLLDPMSLPVIGAEAAQKLLNKSIVPNRLLKSWSKSESLPI